MGPGYGFARPIADVDPGAPDGSAPESQVKAHTITAEGRQDAKFEALESMVADQDAVLTAMRKELSRAVERGIAAVQSETTRHAAEVVQRVEHLERDTRHMRRETIAHLATVPQPHPDNPDEPTDDDIRKQLLYRLYRGQNWRNKYPGWKTLFGGKLLARIRHDRTLKVLRRMESEGLVEEKPKSANLFSLNPAAKARIEEELGLGPHRTKEGSSIAEAEVLRSPAISGLSRKEATALFVDSGEYRTKMARFEERFGALQKELNGVARAAATTDDLARVAGAAEETRRKVADSTGHLTERLDRLQTLVTELESEARALRHIITAAPQGEVNEHHGT